MLMDASRTAPDAEFFYGLYDGVFKPQLVRIAIVLDLFTPLSKYPPKRTNQFLSHNKIL